MGFLSKMKKEMKELVEKMAGNTERLVFAHYMVGLTCHQKPEQWFHDVQCAKDCGIDGFALNIGPSDPWTETQLDLAYSAAEQIGDFVLFLSFDMAAGSWTVPQVVALINHYKMSGAQMVVDGKPFVSTFEGPGWADNWPVVREETGGIFFIPDWSSLGPFGVGEKLDLIDGAFSWDAWPKAGSTKMTTTEDVLYKENLRGKKYMMPVSPCFYTNLPQWSKNWYFSSESLWYDRWQQVLDIMPDYVQILTFGDTAEVDLDPGNDYGESSYICDTVPDQIVPGAEKYTVEYPHSALRALLPSFIAAFKAGKFTVQPPQRNTAVAWYRTTPCSAGPDGDTQWGHGGCGSALNGARDVVSVVALTMEPCPLAVSIGEQCWDFQAGTASPVSYFEVQFDSTMSGPVRISLDGNTSEGPAIVNECCHGQLIFNCVAIRTE